MQRCVDSRQAEHFKERRIETEISWRDRFIPVFICIGSGSLSFRFTLVDVALVIDSFALELR